MSKKISFSNDILKNNKEINDFLEDAGATYKTDYFGGVLGNNYCRF